jgi:hypothetical protein
MERAPQGKDRLDHCKTCGGTWFETGEFPHIYGVSFRKSLVQRAAEQRAAENAAMSGAMLGLPTSLPRDGNDRAGWLSLGLQLLLAFFRFRF